MLKYTEQSDKYVQDKKTTFFIKMSKVVKYHLKHNFKLCAKLGKKDFFLLLQRM